MNFEWRNMEEQHLREDVCLYNMQTKSVFSDRMRMTFLKIPMMEKEAEECETTLERWLYILKHMEKMETIPHSFTKDPVFRNLGRVARYAALNDDDKEAYRKSLKAYRDAYAIAETERSIGKEEGILIGKEEGILIGKEEGILIGEAKERRNSIRTMLAVKVPAEIIAKQYGMTVEEILKIAASN